MLTLADLVWPALALVAERRTNRPQETLPVPAGNAPNGASLADLP